MACVQEWVTAVIGLLGTVVGAGAAMWGSRIAARTSQEAVAAQIRKEDERWVRDQRQAAYHALIKAERAQQRAADMAMGLSGTVVTAEVQAAFDAASHESFDALALIQLCGPPAVLEAAGEMREAGDEIMRDHGLDAARRHAAAVRAFHAEARRALGYESVLLPRTR
jgi:hypothetical protein